MVFKASPEGKGREITLGGFRMVCRGKRLFCLSVITIFIPGLFLFSSKGDTQTRVRFGQTGGNSAHAPFWVTIELGLFKKNGLDVEPIVIRDAPTTARALLAGEVQFGGSSGNATSAAILGGSDLVFIAATYHTMVGFEIWARSGVDLKTLKGKTIGITRFGATTDLVAKVFARENGLTLGGDVFTREIGGVSDLLLALAKGSVDLSILAPPATFKAPSFKGLHKIFDVSDLKLPYLFSPTVTTRRFVRDHTESVRKFMRAYVEGIHFFKKNKEFSIKVMGQYHRLEDRDLLEKDFSIHSKFAQDTPYPSVEGVKTVLEELSGRLPKAKTANPKDFVDDRFVGELEESGFIRQLYER